MEITVKQMMQIEENGHKMGFLKKYMMENAGAAAVKQLIKKFGDVSSKNILVYAGVGNNGGDAMVMARHLTGYDANITFVLLGASDKIKTEESRWNWELLQKIKSIKFLTEKNFDNTVAPDIIIDGILGTGISGDIREPYSSAIDLINKSNAFKLAVDVPSGLDPDTGNTSNIHTQVDITVTFHKMKIGMPKRMDLCGEIIVEKIGIPPEAEAGVL